MPATPPLRDRIAASFSAEELRLLCDDHFPDVGREFGAAMALSERARLLIERCARSGRADALLDALLDARPDILAADRDALLADLAAIAAAPAATPQKLVSATTSQQIGAVSGGLVVGTNIGGTINYHAAPPPPLPPPGALHQLRAPVPDFVGRQDELAAIVAALQPAAGGTAMAISGLRGMGGVGKTELAFAAAQHLAPSFPEAQLVLSLRGGSRAPMSAEQALQQAIRAFAPLAQLPGELAELQALYASCLHGRRVLILADDARDAAQVRPLLPPPGCALLITSRRHFLLPGMAARNLDALPPEDAAALLLRIHPPIGEHAPELARLCGYLPLALRVSAGLLASSTRTVARYLAQLRAARLAALEDPDDPQAGVAASLALSYDALDPPAQAALAQLSVFPASFDQAAGLAVLAVGAAGEALLEGLARRSLLEWDAASERYALHDLVREFAAARLTNAEAARLRHARHYAQVANHSQERYLQGGAALLAGLALFDRERVQLDAGWAWAMAHAGAEHADGLLREYTGATVYIGDLRYDKRRERIPQLEAALAAARRRGERDAEGAWLGNLGIAHADLGDARRAVEFYEQVLVVLRELGDRRGEGNALGNLGLAHDSLGDARRAVAYHEQALVVLRELGDRRGEGAALGNLGIAYKNLGDARRAIEFCEQRLVIAREIGDRRGEAIASWNLGLIYEQQGELERAADLMQVCVDFEREISHSDAEVDAARVAALRQRIAAGAGTPGGA